MIIVVCETSLRDGSNDGDARDGPRGRVVLAKTRRLRPDGRRPLVKHHRDPHRVYFASHEVEQTLPVSVECFRYDERGRHVQVPGGWSFDMGTVLI